jgi:hypothetical protein
VCVCVLVEILVNLLEDEGGLDIKIYLTHVDPTMRDRVNRSWIVYGARPDIEAEFLAIKDKTLNSGHGKVAVLACGPDPLLNQCTACATKLSGLRLRFDVHSEVFAL